MPETPPNPAPASGPAPLIDPNALVATFVAVLKTPADFFKSIKAETGFQKCLVFSVAMMVVAGVLAALSLVLHGVGVGFGILTLVQYLIGGLIGPFIGGAIIWVICMIAGSKAPYENSVRIAGYGSAVSPVAALCTLVPWIGWLAALVVWAYGIYVVVMGAKALNFEPQPPAAAPPAPPAPPQA